MLRVLTGTFNVILGFQSSPAPEGRCYLVNACGKWPGLVSILTGPGGPVLHLAPAFFSDIITFQSSPAPEGRCYTHRDGTVRRKAAFQSSPAPEGRCYVWADLDLRRQRDVSILTGPGGPVLHQNDRTARLLAGVSILTGPGGPVLRVFLPRTSSKARAFQSSPAPEGRCYVPTIRGQGGSLAAVSILTGPGGPVLPAAD